MPRTAGELLNLFRDLPLLENNRLDKVAQAVAPNAEVGAVLRELVRRDWLTAFQSKKILDGEAASLVLGQYVILEPLGKGGMGQVYKARHRLLHRLVALKVIRPDLLSSTEAIRRFQREMRALAGLAHPNIVAAHDADQVGNVHFLVMEYCEGTDLQQVVDRSGPLTVSQACGYVRQAALGLHHAHRKGLVHRDIKPGNLLLLQGTVKILDLGLALLRPTAERVITSGPATQEGWLMGTPDFMAPEQGTNAHAADGRADLYSLGCTLYFLISGQVPFPGGSPLEKVLRHQLEDPIPLHDLCPDLPAEVEAIVRRLMERDPGKRYQTGAEVADALEPFARVNESTSPHLDLDTGDPWPATVLPSVQTSVESRLPGKKQPSRRLFLAGGITLGVGILLSGVVYLWPGRKKTDDLEDEGDHFIDTPQVIAPMSDRWERVQRIDPLPTWAVALAFDRYSKYLAVGGGVDLDKPGPEVEVFVYDLANRKRLWTRKQPSNNAAIAFSPDGTVVATAQRGQEREAAGAIFLYRASSGERLPNLKGHKGGTLCLAFARRGNVIISGGRDGYIRRWQATRQTQIGEMPAGHGGKGWVTALAVSPDGRFLATGGADGTVKLWRWPGTQEEYTWSVPDGGGPVLGLDFSPDGTLLAGNYDHDAQRQTTMGVRLIDLKSNEQHLDESTLVRSFSVRFAPDGRSFATSYPGERFVRWEITKDRKMKKYETNIRPCVFLAFSPDGKWLATTGQDGTSGKIVVDLYQQMR